MYFKEVEALVFKQIFWTKNCCYNNKINDQFWVKFCLFSADVLALKDVYVNTTGLKLVEEGKDIESVTLECHYNLESDRLYSVKWYYDQVEFYRYVAHEVPPKLVFVIQGVIVDVSIWFYFSAIRIICSKYSNRLLSRLVVAIYCTNWNRFFVRKTSK